MKKLFGNIKARVVPAGKLNFTTRLRMFRILETYYDGVCWDSFQHDLSDKNDVILLEHGTDGICGFSTLLCKRMEVGGKKVIGVFSGDTILERKHWGSPALGVRFLIYLWVLKLKNPFTPVYWFLISKGYKTYLIMANNFSKSYPNHRVETPPFEAQLINHFYGSRFGNFFNPAKGVISFGDTKTAKLKDYVAPISDAMRAQVPAIAFFENANPHWVHGDELACIALMTIEMPFRYFLKKRLRSRAILPQEKPQISRENV